MPQYSDRQLELLKKIRERGRKPLPERLAYERAKARFYDTGGVLSGEGYDELTLPKIGALARHLID